MNKPTTITEDMQQWTDKGLIHREDGPARMFLKTKVCEWWLNGIFYTSGEMLNDELFQSYLWKE